jgi:hypothetical protein
MSKLSTSSTVAWRFAAALIVAVMLPGGATLAYEEPGYTVLRTAADYEIRRYEPFIVAEVDVRGSFDDAGNAAFRILANYIFGGNVPADAVDSDSRDAEQGIRMAMTAPVMSAESESEAGVTIYSYGFVMPSEFSLASLPRPLDGRIRLREVPAQLVAARRYSGRWTESRFMANETALLDALKRDGVELNGGPLLARYNSPWTPWFMRRNEILVPVMQFGS